MTLTSESQRPYFFRTCDIDTDIWREGAHIVYVPRGEMIPFTGREKEQSRYAFMGMTNDEKDSWFLDGINSEGLAGGLLLLLEGTGVNQAEADKNRLNGYVGMELVSLFLSACKNVEEVKALAEKIRVCNIPFGGMEVPATMHYFFADAMGDEVILEASDKERPGRLEIYSKEDGIGIMTNSPVFSKQKENLAWYIAASPELKAAAQTGGIPALPFDGRILKGNIDAEHLLRNDTFPASYCSCDRFVRLAVLKALNDSGNKFPDDNMLALGSGIMSSVYEPRSKGIYHYTGFDEKGRPINQKDGFTQYLVMYDSTQRKWYLRAFDEVCFTEYALERCAGNCITRYQVKHDPLAGILKGN
jgi:penicillin V acylase-like amidase (Ntn superfamily)